MGLEFLLVIFVGFSAVAVVLQALSMWRAARVASHLLDNLEQRSKNLEENVQDLMLRVDGLVQSMEPLGTIAEDLKASVDSISEMAADRARDLDKFGQEMLELTREQASKVDYAVTDTVQKFEQTTDLIQKDIIQPAVEVSSFFKGIKAGLSYLFNKKSTSPPAESYPEEELFV